MLSQVLNNLTPDLIASTIKANPQLVPSVLQRFEAFNAFSKALTTEQQVYISRNIDKLASFFQEPDVKEAIDILAADFIKKNTPLPTPVAVAKSKKT